MPSETPDDAQVVVIEDEETPLSHFNASSETDLMLGICAAAFAGAAGAGVFMTVNGLRKRDDADTSANRSE